MEASTTITIELDRYEELIRLEDRVNTAVGMVSRDRYTDRKDILAVLGTGAALCLMARIREEEAEQGVKRKEQLLSDKE